MGFFMGLFMIGLRTNDVSMIWSILLFKAILSIVEFWLAHDSCRTRSYYQAKPSKSTERSIYSILRFLSILALIFLLSLGIWQGAVMRGFNNAVNFNPMIDFMPEGTPLFNSEVPDNMLRLTTDKLARNIVLRNIAEFGSNVRILSNHVTIYNGRLVWVATIGSSDLWTDNRIRGFVVVDANNPEIEAEIFTESFYIGEKLVWLPPFHNRGIKGHSYGINSAPIYGRAYLTPNDEDEWKYVMTCTSISQWSFVEKPSGVFVYNENGIRENFYGMDDIPSWISQMYDEVWMERMVTQWGGHKRGQGFDIWAGGFPFMVNPSTDRVEIHDDTRFIVSPDTNDIISLICVDPKGKQETLAGVFKFSRDGIQYYDLRSYNIMSGQQAQNTIEGEIFKRTTGSFQARMPLLYPINGTYAWFTPIYYEGEQEDSFGHETIKLSGLGIVEANDLDNFAIVMTSEGYKGADLVAEAKRRFVGGEVEPTLPEPEPEPETLYEITGILTHKFDYDVSGNTLYILEINMTTSYYAPTELLDYQIVSQIDQLQIGETISILTTEDKQFIDFAPM